MVTTGWNVGNLKVQGLRRRELSGSRLGWRALGDSMLEQKELGGSRLGWRALGNSKLRRRELGGS